MKSILEKIREELEGPLKKKKRLVPFEKILEASLKMPYPPSFRNALKIDGENPAVIAELKKASPSEGVIREDFDVSVLAPMLEYAGASALSVLTEPNYFLGSIENLKKARECVKIPLLRKDFIFDEYQICEARVAGASAILLIAKMLPKKRIAELIEFADSVGLDVLAEAHDSSEIFELVDCGADIIGLNCRNLADFSTDLSAGLELLKNVPAGIIKVAESAIRNRGDILRARSAGADAVLVGTSIMRGGADVGKALRELLGEKNEA